MLKVETFIKDLNSSEVGVNFISIDDSSSSHLAMQTLEENDHDYLEGTICLEFNAKPILTRDMETTDLLFTWQTLVEPILTSGNKEYEISILDSLYEVSLLNTGTGFIFQITDQLSKNTCNSNEIPEDEYSNVIRNGFLSFGEFILNNKFLFSDESSYSSFMQDYKVLKRMQL